MDSRIKKTLCFVFLIKFHNKIIHTHKLRLLNEVENIK